MTPPRYVTPGRIYLGTRRCTQRQFLLRPDPVVDQLFLYLLAEAAARFEITVFAWVAMSNHYHVLFRDNLGNFPDFYQHLHCLFARAMNHYLCRRENFWSSDQASAVWTVEPVDSFDKLLYVLANPVADHLVDRVTDWPGVSALGQVLSGKPIRVKRPEGFFREHGPMPLEVEIRAARLDTFEALSQDEWRTLILRELTKREELAREKRRLLGRRVMGRKNVLSVSRETRPDTFEPRRRLRPEIACKDWVRKLLEIGRLKAFRIFHRIALDVWRDGNHAVLFPDGTFRMRWYGARTSATSA